MARHVDQDVRPLVSQESLGPARAGLLEECPGNLGASRASSRTFRVVCSLVPGSCRWEPASEEPHQVLHSYLITSVVHLEIQPTADTVFLERQCTAGTVHLEIQSTAGTVCLEIHSTAGTDKVPSERAKQIWSQF